MQEKDILFSCGEKGTGVPLAQGPCSLSERWKDYAGIKIYCVMPPSVKMFIVQAGELACITNAGVELPVPLKTGVLVFWYHQEHQTLCAFAPRPQLCAGAVFGELAALGLTTERSLTIQAKGPAVVYRLDGHDFKASVSTRPNVYQGLIDDMKQAISIWIFIHVYPRVDPGDGYQG